MRYSLASAAVLAFVSSVLAAATPGFDAISKPTQDQIINAGESLDIVWAPDNVTGTVTITLLQGGTPSTLSFGPVVAANIENSLGSYNWTNTSAAAGFATYGFQISLDSAPTTFQFSNPFHINAPASNSSSSSYSGTPSTTTYHVATGTAYVVTSANSTTIAAKPTSSANATITYPSNTTLATTTTMGSATKTPVSVSTGTTGSAAPAATHNAGAHIATGGLAMIGGLLFALAF